MWGEQIEYLKADSCSGFSYLERNNIWLLCLSRFILLFDNIARRGYVSFSKL